MNILAPRAPRLHTLSRYLSPPHRLVAPVQYHSNSFSRPGQPYGPRSAATCRAFSATLGPRKYEVKSKGPDDIEANVTPEEKEHFDRTIAQDKNKQIRTPWMREGSERTPVSRMRSAGAMVKGKLLTTPARLMKLVLPLTTGDYNSDRKDVEPLALLVHPQQPLSYLERLIQSELPMIKQDDRERIPTINFRATDSIGDDELLSSSAKDEETGPDERSKPAVEKQSGEGRQDLSPPNDELSFVRWSKSTELGDFIRDAARGREFEIEIEGAPNPIRVGVPSFSDRTYYLRTRLRKRAREIATMATVKTECDKAAYRSAQNVAYAGFGSMVAWGGIVAWLTFCTDLGWDVMEPVTYLVGLAGVLIGYLWFLLNRREASYQAAMSLTVSRRQEAQYNRRGFDLNKWNYMLDEANTLRREIMAIANEYDVEWSEKADTHDENVIKALKERHGRKGPRDEDEQEDEQDEEERPRQRARKRKAD